MANVVFGRISHKAAGGTEKQQYPVPTGSDLSNGSARERETYGENRVDAAVHQSTVSQRCNVS